MFTFTSPTIKYYMQDDIDKATLESFDSGFKVAMFLVQEKLFKFLEEPRCESKNGCMYEGAMPEYICKHHVRWRMAKEINEGLKEIKNEI